MFLRGSPTLCKDMRRQKIKGTRTRGHDATSTENGGDDSVESTPDSVRPIHSPALMRQELQVHPGVMQHSLFGTRLQFMPRAIGSGDLPNPPNRRSRQNSPDSAPNSANPNPNESNGDWLDKLEKMFCPSTPEQQAGGPLLSYRDAELQLEPRPIRGPPATRAPFFGNDFHEV
jgi:hypothetical protein